jgi:hypothetical protein
LVGDRGVPARVVLMERLLRVEFGPSRSKAQRWSAAALPKQTYK